jgi:hypothetical protein
MSRGDGCAEVKTGSRRRSSNATDTQDTPLMVRSTYSATASSSWTSSAQISSPWRAAYKRPSATRGVKSCLQAALVKVNSEKYMSVSSA